MAVVLNSEPYDLVTVRPSVEWSLTQNAAPAPGFVLYLYYRLNIAGGYLTERLIVRYSPHAALLDYGPEILAALTNDIKDLDDTTAVDETTMKAECYIEYGEIRVDLSDGSEVDLGASTSTPITAIWGGFDFDQADIIDQGGTAPIILSNKPSRFAVYKDQADWIYFAANTGNSAAVRVTIYDKAGSVIFAPTAAVFPAESVIGFPMGGANFYDAWGVPPIASAGYMILEIGQFNGFQNGASLSNVSTYWVDFIGCVDLPEQEFYFMEPKGGWSSFRFEKVEYGSDREVFTFDQYYLKRDTLANRVREGTLAVTQAKGAETFTLSRRLNQESLTMRRYLSGMFGTREHYIRRQKEDGTYHPVRVILDGGGVSVAVNGSAIDVQITCRIANDITEL